MKNRKIKLFAGYQFTSDFFNRAELENAVLRSVKLTNDSVFKENIKIFFKPPDLAPGDIILSQIIERIKESDICIFEISDGNRNVLFEVGVACGLDIPTILLRNTDSEIPVPSDLSGVMYLRYSDTTELGVSLPSVLIQVVKSLPIRGHLKDPKISNFIWAGGDSKETVSLIGGEIKSATSPSDIPGIFYMQSPDVQALVEAGGNLLFQMPDRDVQVMSSGLVKSGDLEQHLVLVGGPRSNSISGQLLQRLSLPWKYELGNHYLPIKERMRTKSLRKGDDKLKPEFEGDNVRRDVALLSFGPNPFNMSKRFLLLSGAFTFGVMGSARSVSMLRQTDRNLSFLSSLCHELKHTEIVQIVMHVDIINDQVVTPDLESAIMEIIR